MARAQKYAPLRHERQRAQVSAAKAYFSSPQPPAGQQ